ncbi:tRNA lysidine(34) synthetase TilS [Bacillus aquiflavi]|uniref:tRNA(Ile)-lysidine synthase n=1 Tax=Bacillus aquiflavi TaxID=2672567 RepID=A0A6B3VXF5_9BACI|nr:tRNA lysidine(34) synthetase TilS [Bacillus aquiflavi]MBA4538414.1 tRNA lysidine(34) synthetase TilS [Bacillus aquiflavi]NEY82779.1 tRNA lysidine(34) synthetase TilS [Bacillus aquiflavi]UAC48242.1 tRNA lysidine(34) synthetase TilS [Bacillus aquiflavi]
MLEKKVDRFIDRHSLISEGARILVGVSGGPDSLSLLHYLWERKEKWNLTMRVAHVDHMFRGRESFDDLIFVKEYCNNLHIPIETAQLNVPKYIEETGESPQVAARKCRYLFFKEMMAKHQLDILALGHHGDDQVETILMRLIRGSTGKARAGITVKRSFYKWELIRPFLTVNKEEITDYCLRHHLKPRTDPSNEKGIYTRNRLRKEVLSFLKKENAHVHEHFQRFSEELLEDEALLQELTIEKMKTVMEIKNIKNITLNIRPFQSMPIPLQRRGIQLILNYLYHEKPSSLSAIHIDQIFSLISSSQPSKMLHFPLGLLVYRSYEKCHFQFSKEEKQCYRFELHKPGKIQLPNGSEISLQYTNDSKRVDHYSILLDPLKVKLPIIIRTRKEGDRIIPKGMQGSKKIKTIFIDEKIPRTERKDWPVITDCEGEVLWLPGLKKSNWDMSNKTLSNYMLLTFEKH